jgi:hypothetical protein
MTASTIDPARVRFYLGAQELAMGARTDVPRDPHQPGSVFAGTRFRQVGTEMSI